MKVIIIDDDAASIEALVRQLKDYEEIELAGTAQNGTKGITLVKKEQPDLLFLDVELPDMTGLDFLEQMKSISSKPCRVVIYTAHSMYMLPAFRSQAFDFLMKPVATEELQKIMQRFFIAYDEHETATTSRWKENEKLLLYVNATDFQVVNIPDVGLFQYNHDLRAWEVLVGGRQNPIRLKRSANNESLLAIDACFVQVSQRHIININYLMEVKDGVCRFYPPFDTFDQVKVGRIFRKQLTERFNAL